MSLSPDMANVAYGEHERNRLDVFCAKTSSPSPVVLQVQAWFFGSRFDPRWRM